MKVTVILIVLETFGTVSTGLENKQEELEIKGRIKTIQNLLEYLGETWRDMLSPQVYSEKIIC